VLKFRIKIKNWISSCQFDFISDTIELFTIFIFSTSFEMVCFQVCLLFVIISSTSSLKQELEPYMRFTNVKCLTSNISVSGFKCFIKSYSRRNTTLNVFVNLTKSIHDIKVRYDLRYKSLSNAQRSIINTTIEVCSFLNGTDTNPVFKWLIGVIPNLSTFLHPCPYQVCVEGDCQKVRNWRTRFWWFWLIFPSISGKFIVWKHKRRSKVNFISISWRNLRFSNQILWWHWW
jgi:hypothetical protein